MKHTQYYISLKCIKALAIVCTWSAILASTLDDFITEPPTYATIASRTIMTSKGNTKSGELISYVTATRTAIN